METIIRIKETNEDFNSNYSINEKDGLVYIFGENGRLISDYALKDVEIIHDTKSSIKGFASDWCDYLPREQSKKLIELGIDNSEASFTNVYYSGGKQVGEDDVYIDADGHIRDYDGFEVDVEIKERWRGEYNHDYEDDAPIFSVGDIMRILSHSLNNRFQISMDADTKTWVCQFTNIATYIFKSRILDDALYNMLVQMIECRH